MGHPPLEKTALAFFVLIAWVQDKRAGSRPRVAARVTRARPARVIPFRRPITPLPVSRPSERVALSGPHVARVRGGERGGYPPLSQLRDHLRETGV